MRKYLLVLLLTFPLWALADDSSSKSLFMPADSDMSVLMLGSMFGMVEGVLHGGGTQVLGAMFSVFNAAVLIFGSIMMAYILIMSTINTAHEGEMLGRKWSSTWVPIRVVIAIVLLLPKASGYSLVQVIVMYVVMAGVGAADTVWNKVLDYMQKGGQIMAPEHYQGNELYGYDKLGGKVLQSQICMFNVQNQINEKRKKDGKPNINFAASLHINDITTMLDQQKKARGISLMFPGYVDGYGQFAGKCGVISWSNPEAVPGFDPYTPSKLALWQVVLDTQGAASLIANNLASLKTTGDITNLVTNMPLINAGRDYVSIFSTLRVQQNTNFDDHTDKGTKHRTAYEDAKSQGWMLAGSYFMAMVKSNQQKTANTKYYSLPSFSQDFCANKPGEGAPDEVKNAYTSVCENNALNDGTADEQTKKLRGYIPANIAEFDSLTKQFQDSTMHTAEWLHTVEHIINPIASFGNVPGVDVVGDLGSLIVTLIKVFKGVAILQNPTINTHPIQPLMMIGDGYLDIGTLLLKISAKATIIASLLGAVPAVNPLGFGITGAASIASGIITALSGGFYATGLMLTMYLPLVPALIFTFAVIGWILGVLESIVAAPIVALGVASPASNNELFGKAEPAIMLLLNLFLRPTLIIFGLVAGIILSAVGVWVLSFMFEPATIIHNYAREHWTVSFDFIVKIMIYILAVTSCYVMTVTVIFQKSFALIHVLPDKVMRWLSGGHQSQFGSEFTNAEQDSKGAVSESGQTAHKAVQAGSAEFGKAGAGKINEGIQAAERAKKEEGKSDMSTTSQKTEPRKNE